MSMTSTQLEHAAACIGAAATLARDEATAETRPAWRDLRSGVAQQLQDRADQVATWANNMARYEARGEDVPADVADRIEAATREFLAMARS